MISRDAYNEFAVADYKEVSELAPKLPAETLLEVAQGPEHPRQPLRALRPHARPLRQAGRRQGDSRTARRQGTVVHQRPRRHRWPATSCSTRRRAGSTSAHLDQERERVPRQVRRARTARFFWEFRPDVIPHKQVLEGMKMLMEQPDIADMPIEDLRKWKVVGADAAGAELRGQGVAQHDPDQQPGDPEVRHRGVVGRPEEHRRRRVRRRGPRRRTPSASSSSKNC